jgi:hypothetical protein
VVHPPETKFHFQNHLYVDMFQLTIYQASGHVGKFIVEALLETGKHTVTAITRADSTNEFPSGVHVKKVNYDDQFNLVSALKGKDALINAMSGFAPPKMQIKLIEAAAAANVPWFLPNEYGTDPLNLEMRKDTFLTAAKEHYGDHIESLGKSSWIAISCGFWYEYSLAGGTWRYGFDFKERTVQQYDEGKTTINTSTWPQVGRAVAALMSLKIAPDGEDDGSVTLTTHFKNKPAYISSFTISQSEMLESVLRVSGTELKDWKLTSVPVKEYYKAGVEEFQKGNKEGFGKALYSRAFFPDSCGNFGATRGLDNDVLGLPEENLDGFTKIAIQMAEKGVD